MALIKSLAGVHESLKSSSATPQDPYIHVQPDDGDDDSRFYIQRPKWRLGAMAHAMAQTARYRGNADEFYSVAEHCCLVAALMAEVTGGDPYEGLMHDATESILPDVSAPFKQLLPDLRAIEHRLDADLREKFGLPTEKSQECTHADWLALFIEAAQIVPERGADFVDPYGFREQALDLRQAGWSIVCLPWREAKEQWLDAYAYIKHGVPIPPRTPTTKGVSPRGVGFEEAARGTSHEIVTFPYDPMAHMRGHQGFGKPGRRYTPT